MVGLRGEKQRKRGNLCFLVLFFLAKGKKGLLAAECERVRFFWLGKWPAMGDDNGEVMCREEKSLVGGG